MIENRIPVDRTAHQTSS
uniref:Uncharacterized protein n=1 Tax=Anguilla anguilla TaxID=7936 RepID=A0A0E9VCC6_ANGAN